MKINLPQRPNPNDLANPAFLARHTETVVQALSRNISFTDNMQGAVMTVALAHGVPTLVANPLPQSAGPLGVLDCQADTQLKPSVTVSKTAIVNGVLTTAPKDKLFLTAIYPLLGTVLTDWVSYTPTGSWTTNTTYTGFWRRVGDSIECRMRLGLAGAPNAVTLTDVFLPSGMLIDTTKITATGNGQPILGYGNMICAGVGNYLINLQYHTTSSVIPVYYSNPSTTLIDDANITATAPGAFANGDRMSFFLNAPIVGWSSAPSVTANVTLFLVGA